MWATYDFEGLWVGRLGNSGITQGITQAILCNGGLTIYKTGDLEV